jgi:antitoxin component of MazEF toxin-antitoxin module
MNKRQLKIIIGKSGGNSSKNTLGHKISLPNVWMQQMGITPDDRTVDVKFDGQKIIIEKSKGAETIC